MSDQKSQSQPYEKTVVIDTSTPQEQKTIVMSDTSLQNDKTAAKQPIARSRDSHSGFNPLLELIGDTFNALTGYLDDDESADFLALESEDKLDGDNGIVSVQGDDDLPLAKVEAQYTLKTKIAEGGQGRITQALDKTFHRTVAIKSLHEKLLDKQEIRSAFVDEAEITAQLEHPSIVPIYGLYSDDHHGLHLAMKLIKGKTLRDHLTNIIAKYQKVSHSKIIISERKMLRQRLEFFLKVCDALAYVHHKKIIHRDLKPENIMIGRFNETYIMDWGIAMKFSPENPQPAPHITGTPRYVSPDILNRQPLDQRSDIYLLGTILFEIVFLKRAFPQETQKEALEAAKYGEVDSFTHAFGYSIDNNLKAIIAKALAFEQGERYELVGQLSQDLRNYLNDEAVTVCPNPFMSKTLRLVRRHSQFLITLVVLLCFAVIIGTSIMFIHEYQRQIDETNAKETLSKITSNGLRSGLVFDNRLTLIENNLQSMARECTYRLNTPDLKNKNINYYDYQAGKSPDTAPPGFKYSDFFDTGISYDAIAYKLSPGEQINNIDAILNALQPMFLAQKGKLLANMDEDMPDYFSSPVVRLYTGFKNGLQICYPYHSQYQETFDPRERPWYKVAMEEKPGKVAWGKPYAHLGNTNTLVLTASTQILDAEDNPIGVIGMDILFDNIIQSFVNEPNTSSYISARYLISQEGFVYADTSMRLKPAVREGKVILRRFTDDNILDKMLAKKNGMVFADTNQKASYLFLNLRATNWMYVEKLNYQDLINKTEFHK